ncbi:uncharacterized protein LOC100373462 [Saccoglossus kowalevskii]|uniref:Serine/threonine-protein phosphatase 4 regulatory subunit 2-A-like n=1 Tax=Saccoglossus kowalevskii TaxID=10224 RepID=A0ABM0GLG3_SACKO|nr:PREDICTED: serine/threonine-protein phosphatase 4 regulatory subunit 2-A-like [Saccoglossus kowalevskii]
MLVVSSADLVSGTMDDPDCILDALNDFEKKNCNDIPDRLEQLLCDIARTGEIRFPWSKVKKLFICKLELAIEEFVDCNPNEEIPVLPNVENVEFEEMKIRLMTALETFSSAPFTIQRLCELVIEPKKYYSRSDKFMRGIEKNVVVVTTVKPYNRLSTSEPTTNGTAMVNGLLSECITHVPTEFSSENDEQTEMLIEKTDDVSSTEIDHLEDASEDNEQLSDEAETEGDLEEKEVNTSSNVESSDNVLDQTATVSGDTETMQVTSSEEQTVKTKETDCTETDCSMVTSLEETTDKVSSLEETTDKVTSLEETTERVANLDETDNNATSLDETSDKMPSLEETSDNMASLVESSDMSSLEDGSNKVTSLEETSDNLTSLEETGNKSSSLEETSNKVTSLEETSNKVTSLEESSNKVTSLEESSNKVTSLEESSNKVTSLEGSTEETSAIVSTTVSDSGECEDINKSSGDNALEAAGRKHKDNDTDVCEPNAKRPRYDSEDVEKTTEGEDELNGVGQSETNSTGGEAQSKTHTLDNKPDDKQDDVPVSELEEPKECEGSKEVVTESAGDTRETDSKVITEQITEQIETEIKLEAGSDKSTDKTENKPVESEEPMDQS